MKMKIEIIMDKIGRMFLCAIFILAIPVVNIYSPFLAGIMFCVSLVVIIFLLVTDNN